MRPAHARAPVAVPLTAEGAGFSSCCRVRYDAAPACASRELVKAK